MAYNLQISDALAEQMLNAINALANGGFIDIWAGTQPANCNTTASGTPLATLTLPNPAFAAATASGGVASVSLASAIASVTAGATGAAIWFRVHKSGDAHTAAGLFDGTVGTGSGYDLLMNSTAISSGATVAISALQFSLNESGT